MAPAGEGRAEPLLIGRVPTVDQQRQAHAFADQSRGGDRRAGLVAHLGRPRDERLLVGDAPPLARQQPAPQLVRVPRQRSPDRGDRAAGVGVHGSRDDAEQPLLRRQQPVERRHPGGRVDAEVLHQPAPERGDGDVVGGLEVIPAEPHGPATELAGQARRDRPLHRVERCLVLEEHQQARPPSVVGRALGVVAEDVGAPAQQRGAMGSIAQQRPHDVVVKRTRELRPERTPGKGATRPRRLPPRRAVTG